MWLLSTDRAELHFFSSPEAVTGGYAILSHTWGKHEQSYQETRALRRRCEGTDENPRNLASRKIRKCCVLAERHGYRWLWVDTCCIDKTSSIELSEAINSMFRWYSLAEVCYAYLEDVDSNCDLDAPESAFRTARWHTRGWTLQELIAPSLAIFVSRDWKIIGNKVGLAPLLQELTGVFSRVLTREAHYSTASIAERMSWASNRRTTRVEDEAYCLMGLFNVDMSTIYGEGRQAFQRLQHEIMKQSFDTSLFAWGPHLNSELSLTPLTQREMYQCFSTPSSRNHVHLLASSPKPFAKQDSLPVVRYTPGVKRPFQPYLDSQLETMDELQPETRVRRRLGPFGRIELPRFSATSFGLECRFPIIESDGLTVAVLLCDNSREHIGLLLHPSKNSIQDPTRKKYYSGCCNKLPFGGVSFARLVSLGDDLYNLKLNGETVTAEWRDIFIADSPQAIMKDVLLILSSQLNCIVPAPPFRLPHWLISSLMSMGMDPVLPLHMASKPVDGMPLQMAAVFLDMDTWEGIRLILGTCTQSSGHRPLHWAKAMPQCLDNWSQRTDYSHNCLRDHVDAWNGWTKDFGDTERTIRLSFSRCKLVPEHTLVVHVELEGCVYDAMKDKNNVVFPSREEAALGKHVAQPGPPLPPGTRPLSAPHRRSIHAPQSRTAMRPNPPAGSNGLASGATPYGTSAYHLGWS
ncbi:hypothetical protein V8D89_003466 [Ganoderma adspersum]